MDILILKLFKIEGNDGRVDERSHAILAGNTSKNTKNTSKKTKFMYLNQENT
jgi:hypothetical protein